MRPLQPSKTKEQIAQEQQEYYDAVMERFEGNCVVCYPCRALGVTVHEIVPRSHRPKNWWEVSNGCCLCQPHHELVHSLTSEEAKVLLELHIEKTLRAMGKL